MNFAPAPVLLEGRHVRLGPLETRRASPLFEAGRDPAIREWMLTPAFAVPARRAIARLGAVEEGTLRNYQTRHDGYVRDTVMFSITAAEWPAAKAGLGASLLR